MKCVAMLNWEYLGRTRPFKSNGVIQQCKMKFLLAADSGKAIFLVTLRNLTPTCGAFD